MKVLYVSRRFETNVCAQIHCQSIKELVGETQVYTIDLQPYEPKISERYIAYGKYKNKIDRIIRCLQGNMMYISNKIIEDICLLIRKTEISIVFIEDSIYGNLIKSIKTRFPNVKVIVFYHDIGADLFIQWKKHTKSLSDKIEYSLGLRQEIITQMYCDVNIVLNRRDADLYKKHYNKEPECIMPISTYEPQINVEEPVNKKQTANKKKMLFVGSTYFPNILGIRWFYHNVLPKLSSNMTLVIVGRGTEKLKNEFTDERVKIVGGVESLDSYYIDADIVIAPIFEGGGMKTKTVEALSFGKVFVGTTESLTGFWEEMDGGIRDRYAYLCNTEDEWGYVLNKLENEDTCRLNRPLFDLYTAKFSYEATREIMKLLLF